MSEHYNKSKIRSFLSNENIKYSFYENESNYHFLFIENNTPIASIDFYQSNDDNLKPYYFVSGVYSESGLGKILYYISLMHMSSLGHHVSHSIDGDIRGYANTIWEQIQKDKSVQKIKLTPIDLDLDDEFFPEYAFSKQPDDFFDEVIRTKLIKTPKTLINIANSIFHTIYDGDLTNDEIDELLLIEKTSNFSKKLHQRFSNGEKIIFDSKNNNYHLVKNNKSIASIHLSENTISQPKGHIEDISLLIEFATHEPILKKSNTDKIEYSLSTDCFSPYQNIKSHMQKIFFENFVFDENKMKIIIPPNSFTPLSLYEVNFSITDDLKSQLKKQTKNKP